MGYARNTLIDRRGPMMEAWETQSGRRYSMIRDEISELNDWLNGLVQTSEYMLSENELGSDNWWRDYFNAVGADIPGRRGVIECRFFLRAAKKALLEEAYLFHPG